MKTIAVLNQKGGVGKSSCIHHLSGSLALKGQRVLLIDVDPQASLSQGFFGPSAVAEIDPADSVATLYAGNRPFPEQVIRPTGTPGVDIIPGSQTTGRFNLPCPDEAPEEAQICLREFLVEVAPSYDLCLIDCPPNLALCSWAALVAADYLVVPVKPEDYSAQGLPVVNHSVELVQAGPNPGLVNLGYLLTMVSPRRKLHQLFEAHLRDGFGPLVFDSRFTEAVPFAEAITARLPICRYKPKGAHSRLMAQIAEEVLTRMEAASSGTIAAALEEAIA